MSDYLSSLLTIDTAEREWKIEFHTFKHDVDTALIDLCGMVSDDLPDYNYSLAFEEGISATDTAENVIAHAMTF